MTEKKIFTQADFSEPQTETLQPKKRFASTATVEVDLVEENSHIEAELQQSLQPKLTWLKRGFIVAVLLFLIACIAQSVQWLIVSWQQNQWISLSFAVVSVLVVFIGISALFKELFYLRQLKRHQQLQQQSQQVLQQSAVGYSPNLAEAFSPLQMEQLCLELARQMELPKTDPALSQWQSHLQGDYKAQEIAYLFSQYVLQPRDKLAQKLIMQSAVESALVVTVSPLAIVDMLFVAWRNIRLVNKIASIYRMELGYWSRLRLFKMVLLNLAFAGATEVVQEMSLDWLSQDMAAKVSARVAQGMGVGLLTARLGFKAMSFCRPLVFTEQEKPRLSHIQQNLLSSLKQTVFQSFKLKNNEHQSVK